MVSIAAESVQCTRVYCTYISCTVLQIVLSLPFFSWINTSFHSITLNTTTYYNINTNIKPL